MFKMLEMYLDGLGPKSPGLLDRMFTYRVRKPQFHPTPYANILDGRKSFEQALNNQIEIKLKLNGASRNDYSLNKLK